MHGKAFLGGDLGFGIWSCKDILFLSFSLYDTQFVFVLAFFFGFLSYMEFWFWFFGFGFLGGRGSCPSV